MTATQDAQRRPIRILANARDLVDAISLQGAMTPAEIADATSIPRPSVYRLAEGLAAIGLVTIHSDSRIDLNLRWLHLADSAQAGMREWAGSAAILGGISESTEQTAYLTVPRGGEAVCIDWSQGRGIGVLVLKPGGTLPLYAGAAGRVALADYAEVDHYLMDAPFEALTPYTLTTKAALSEDIALTKRQGFAHSDQDVTVGIGALGVPVRRTTDGAMIGCLSIGGPADEIRDRTTEFVDRLRAAAAQLSELHAQSGDGTP